MASQVTQSRQDGVYHGQTHIATHEQFPSVHRDQVADKPLRPCPCLVDTILAAAGTLLTVSHHAAQLPWKVTLEQDTSTPQQSGTLEGAAQDLWTVLVCMCKQVRGESDVGMPFRLDFFSIRFHLRLKKNFEALQRKGYYHGQFMYFCLNECSDVYIYKHIIMSKIMYMLLNSCWNTMINVSSSMSLGCMLITCMCISVRCVLLRLVKGVLLYYCMLLHWRPWSCMLTRLGNCVYMYTCMHTHTQHTHTHARTRTHTHARTPTHISGLLPTTSSDALSCH